jgi:hypothetical protein
MTKTELAPSINELVEYVGMYFTGSKTPKQAWDLFDREQAELQKALVSDPATLGRYLDESPHYVAAALVGKVTLKPGEQTRRLTADSSSVTLEELRAAKCISAHPAAHPLMDAINPTGKLPKILALITLALPRLKLPQHP